MEMTQSIFCSRHLARFGRTNCCCVQGMIIMKIDTFSPKRRYVLTTPQSCLFPKDNNLTSIYVCDTIIRMYINQQDAQISVIKLYIFNRCSTCFRLYYSIFRSNILQVVHRIWYIRIRLAVVWL